MGVAVAQQMAKQMNAAMQNTIIPGIQTAPISATATSFHVVLDGKPAGPFNDAEISRLIVEGKIKKNTYVWRLGMGDWSLVENTPEVMKLVALSPPPFIPEDRS